MEDTNNTSAPILDDGQFVDPLYYIAFSSPSKLQKVIYDFGGKPANSKEELYAMAAAMRAAPSGGKKFMKAVYGNAHPDTDDILEAIKQSGKKCNCDSCRHKSSYGGGGGGCGCSSSYSDTEQSVIAIGVTSEYEKKWCGYDLSTLQDMLNSRLKELSGLLASETVKDNSILIKRIEIQISALKRCIEDKQSEAGKTTGISHKNPEGYFSKLPTWAKITGAAGAASLLTLGMIKIAQQVSK